MARLRLSRRLSFVRVSAALLCAGILLTVGAAGLVGFVWTAGEVPCALGGLERAAVLLAGVTLFFVSAAGLTRLLAGLLLSECLIGLWLTARHLGHQATGDIGQGFGSVFWGLHGYSWSLLLFVALLIWLALALMSEGRRKASSAPPISMTDRFSRLAGAAAVLILGLNALTVLIANGPPPFAGIGIPDRLRYETVPERWSAALWARLKSAPVFFERPFLKTPDLSRESLSPKEGPLLPLLPSLTVQTTVVIPSPFESGADVRAFAWDPVGRRFGFAAVTPEVVLTDRTMHRVTARAVPDAVNGQTLDASAGTVWFGGKLVTASQNKTLWAVESDYRTEAGPLHGFAETTGNLRLSWDKVRPTVRTVRAHNAFVQSLAADEAGSRLFLLTAPNPEVPDTILVTLDGTDLMPVAERVLKPGPQMRLKTGRTLREYRITSAVYADGLLYAWSPVFSSLLTIDPDRAQVRSVRAVSGVHNVRAMTVRDGSLLFLQTDTDGLRVSAAALSDGRHP